MFFKYLSASMQGYFEIGLIFCETSLLFYKKMKLYGRRAFHQPNEKNPYIKNAGIYGFTNELDVDLSQVCNLSIGLKIDVK